MSVDIPRAGRLSTNDKISMILNHPDEDREDDDVTKRKKDSNIKQRVRRSVLYGSGSRANLPTVKKSKPVSSSPFALGNQFNNQYEESHKETSTAPPGAHDDQYRILKFKTTVNHNDPDRVFYTTTSMTEGVRYISQPPWYVGNQNNIIPPDTSIVTSATRYGFRGSKAIQQYLTEPVRSPIRTRTQYTPKFLKAEYIVNEWVPPLSANPLTDGYQLTTPKLWPENATFVTGYQKKQIPTSSLYINQTTIASPHDANTASTIDNLYSTAMEEQSLLLDYSKLERTSNLLSRPMTEQMIFQTKWNDHLMKSSSASLQQIINQPPERITDKYNLLDTTDKLRYASSTAVVVHTQSSELLKMKGRTEALGSLIPHAMKWNQCFVILSELNIRLKKEQTTTDAFLDLCTKLHFASMQSQTIDTLRRMQFIRCMNSMEVFEHLKAKHLSLFYSTFDPLNTGSINLVDVASALYVLIRPEDSALEKLIGLWTIYENYGHNLRPLDVCLTILCACCNSPNDRDEMQLYFKQKFRPKCFHLSVYKETLNPPGEGEGEGDKTSSSAPSNDTDPTSPPSTSSPKSPLLPPQDGKKKGGMRESRSAGGLLPSAYNICDAFLNQQMFREILEECPEVVELFDYQLSLRLTDCYGRDPRIIVKAVESPEDEPKGFAWIISKNKRAVAKAKAFNSQSASPLPVLAATV